MTSPLATSCASGTLVPALIVLAAVVLSFAATVIAHRRLVRSNADRDSAIHALRAIDKALRTRVTATVKPDDAPVTAEDQIADARQIIGVYLDYLDQDDKD